MVLVISMVKNILGIRMTLVNEIINNSDTKVSMIVTGGGSLAISELLRHGGASNVFISGFIPYHPEVLIDRLQYVPDKFVSKKVAIDLAHKTKVPLSIEDRILNVSCTASLRKNSQEREGRVHEAYIATYFYSKNYSYTDCYHVIFNEERTREQEEELLANILLSVIDQNVNLRKLHFMYRIDSIGLIGKDEIHQVYFRGYDCDIIGRSQKSL